MSNFYRVYYLNIFQAEFSNRDDALNYVIRAANHSHRSMGDYEILDRSDF